MPKKLKWILNLTGGVLLIIGVIGLIIVASPDEKPKRVRKKTKATKPIKKPIKKSRVLSGIFKLPADGTIIRQDIQGRKLYYKKGERVRFERLTSPPGAYACVNRKIPSWKTKKRVYTSGRAIEDGSVSLMSLEGKILQIKVRIIHR